MSSASISSSGDGRGVRRGYMECYDVMYSAGPLRKPGNRVWHDGILTFYTINNKLMLRNKGHLVAECFHLVDASEQPRKDEASYGSNEGGEQAPSFAVGQTYQISEEEYTVEIQRVRFIHEKTLDMAAVHAAARLKRKSTDIDDPSAAYNYLKNATDPFKDEDGKDVVLKKPDVWGKPVSKASTVSPARSSIDRSAGSKRKKPFVLTESDCNNTLSAFATNNSDTDRHKDRIQPKGTSNDKQPSLISRKASTTITLKGGRVSGIRKSSARREAADYT